jgi:hypothetical protein
MNHWQTVLPDFMLQFRYEELVGDLEVQSRRLLDYCGLEWQSACLDFHKTKRPVKTASASQVRQVIYSSSVGSWKHYEKQLAPLIEMLDR